MILPDGVYWEDGYMGVLTVCPRCHEVRRCPQLAIAMRRWTWSPCACSWPPSWLGWASA